MLRAGNYIKLLHSHHVNYGTYREDSFGVPTTKNIAAKTIL